eukprot:jgi/Psemu1/52778/gm1.52778_g
MTKLQQLIEKQIDRLCLPKNEHFDYNLLDMLKNPEIEESLDQKAASGITHAQKLADLADYFDTDGMFESIGEMDN